MTITIRLYSRKEGSPVFEFMGERKCASFVEAIKVWSTAMMDPAVDRINVEVRKTQ